MAMTNKPYDEYTLNVYRRIRQKRNKWHWGSPKMSQAQFRALLADAWLAGLGYSLNLIEGEKERRNVHTS